jgi:hypothetical protein
MNKRRVENKIEDPRYCKAEYTMAERGYETIRDITTLPCPTFATQIQAKFGEIYHIRWKIQ